MSFKSGWKIRAAALLLIPLCARAIIAPPGFVNVTLATGFTNASVMGVAPDGRVFVCQQAGLVRVVKDGVVLPAPFVSVATNPTNSSNNEGGLLGFTFDPGFSSNNFVYLNYTATNVAPGAFVQRISRFTASGDVAVPGSEVVLLETDPFTAVREIGGALRFGMDGLLYIGVGQAGPTNNSQTLTNLFGKILRINKDGTIPPSNPFFGSTTGKNRAIWALGLRNPFMFSIQPGTGRMFINEVGSAMTPAREEINEGVAGLNYGWPNCEGPCSPTNASFRDPLHFYSHANGDGACAITGGTFYNPVQPQFPAQFVGKYFFTDNCAAWIKVFDPATLSVSAFATNASGSTDLQVGPDGSLYYLARGSGTNAGFVGKIVYGAATIVPFGGTWKYLDDGITNIAANWMQPGFDDSSWANGVAQLGYGGNGEVTTMRITRTDGSRIISTYFRRSFVVTNPALYSNLVVNLVRDDGGVVYLNGTEVFRNNMPAGNVASSTFAVLTAGGVDERVAFGGLVNPALLVSGTNVLAAELHQSNTNASPFDASFNLAFFALTNTLSLRAESSGAGRVALAYPSWANRFTIEAASTLPTNTWSVVTNASTVVSNELRVNVNVGPSNQFFRLRSP